MSSISGYVGVDAGGSSTRAVLLSCTTAEVIGRSQCMQPGNPHVHGLQSAVSAVSTSIKSLIETKHDTTKGAGIQVKAITVALSGGDDKRITDQFSKMLANELGIDTEHTKIIVVHDATAPTGLVMNNNHDKCIVVVSGTGSVAGMYEYEEQAIQLTKRAGGRGPKLGDKGSAYAIAISIISHALCIYDNIEMPHCKHEQNKDELQQPVLEILKEAYSILMNENVQNLNDFTDDHVNNLVAFIHSSDCTRDKIASLTGDLFISLTHNKIVTTSLEQAAHDLLSLLHAVQIHESSSSVKIILTGGVFQALHNTSTFHDILYDGLLNYHVYTLVDQHAAAVGAARLAAIFSSASLPNSNISDYLQPLAKQN